MIVPALLITTLAGILGGSVLAPIKRMTQWPFGKSWAIYSVWAYLVSPWLLALLTVPHLTRIYTQVSLKTMLICAGCGVGWGTAVVLFGIAVNLIGISLATALTYGFSIAVGSLAPLLIAHPERLLSKQGLGIALADAGIVAGVFVCAWAGKQRDAVGGAQTAESTPSDEAKGRFLPGVLAALLAAALSSLLNIALAFGGEFNRLAIANGASPLNAANAQWAFTVTFGYLPNVLLSVVVFSRRGLWKNFFEGPVSYWVWAAGMAFMWIAGTALYGAGANLLGEIGPVIGWPIYMSLSILAGVFWGWMMGEWSRVSGRVVRHLELGIVLQVVSIVFLGVAGK